MFSIKEHIREKKEKFRNHCRKEILDIVESGQVITKDTLPKRMNSYEAQLLMPLWDDALFLDKIKYYIDQAGNEFYETPDHILPTDYNDAIKTKLIFILIERFENLLKRGENENE